jgi:hypothetical protein
MVDWAPIRLLSWAFDVLSTNVYAQTACTLVSLLIGAYLNIKDTRKVKQEKMHAKWNKANS